MVNEQNIGRQVTNSMSHEASLLGPCRDQQVVPSTCLAVNICRTALAGA